VHLAIAASAGLLVGPLAGVAVAAPALPSVQVAQADVLATQDLIDAASATLASVRTALSTAQTPGEVTTLGIQQSRLQAHKTALIARLAVEQRILTRAIAAQAAADARTAALNNALVSTAPPLLSTLATAGLPAPGALATSIDGFLATVHSPLTGLGAVFVADGEAEGVDPRFIVAISGAETSFGTYGPAQAIHNPFGLGPNIHFPSWSAAIQGAATNLGGPLYRGAGLTTIPQIQARWAPLGVANDPGGLNSNWQINVDHYFSQLGGNPSGSVMTGVSNSLISLTPATPPVGSAGPAAATTALTLIGVPSPADSPNGLNDVQLVQTVYQDQGVNLPGTLAGLETAGVKVAPQALKQGDAVFFSGVGGAIVHVGLYLGGGQFIHAPGPGRRVEVASLYAAPWRSSYAMARRY
jgi:cell wall-associated NlpC family hydrolase